MVPQASNRGFGNGSFCGAGRQFMHFKPLNGGGEAGVGVIADPSLVGVSIAQLLGATKTWIPVT